MSDEITKKLAALYYGNGITQYLHRSVLKAAIKELEKPHPKEILDYEEANELARKLEKRGIKERSPELLATAWMLMELVDYICEQESIFPGNGY